VSPKGTGRGTTFSDVFFDSFPQVLVPLMLLVYGDQIKEPPSLGEG